MTVITVQMTITGPQVPATPREQPDATEVFETVFAATLEEALSPCVDGEQVALQSAPDTRGAPRACARDDRIDQADGDLLAALLALGPLAHGGRIEVGPPSSGPGVAAPKDAAGADTVLGGSSPPASLPEAIQTSPPSPLRATAHDLRKHQTQDEVPALISAASQQAHVSGFDLVPGPSEPAVTAPKDAGIAAALLERASVSPGVTVAPPSLLQQVHPVADHRQIGDAGATASRAALDASTTQTRLEHGQGEVTAEPLAIGSQAHAVRVEVAPGANGPADPAPTAAATLARGESFPVALGLIAAAAPGVGGSEPQASAPPPAQPLAIALHGAQARGDADATAATPQLGAATSRDGPSSDQAASRPIGGQSPPASAYQPEAVRPGSAPHMAPAAVQRRETAVAHPSATIQIVTTRPTDAHAEQQTDTTDRAMSAAPSTPSIQPPVSSSDIVAARAAAVHVPPPVGSQHWGAALSQHIVRLSSGGEVELSLNPVELGPLKVKLSFGAGQAQVVFVSDHLAVRAAIEAAIPQLRSSLADSGISLGEATVGSGSGDAGPQQRPYQPAPQQHRMFQADTARAETTRSAAAAGERGSASAVDTFA